MSLASFAKDKIRVTVRIGILTVFISVFMTLSLLILALISYRFYANSLILTNQITTAISSSVLREVSIELNPAHSASTLSARLIESKTLQKDNVDQVMEYTKNVLSALPQTQMVYLGDEAGNFVISRRMADGTVSSEIIDRRSQEPDRKYLTRNDKGEVINVRQIEKIDYDPRARPWYQAAKEHLKPVWSKVYIFYSGETKTLGITSASPVMDKDGELIGVFGIDVKLAAIEAFLSKQKITENGRAMILGEDGKIIALPGSEQVLKHINTAKQPELNEAYLQYLRLKQNKFGFEYQGVKYHASVFSVPEFEVHKWLIFTVVPEDDITGPVKKAYLQTLAICGVLLIGGLLLISAFSKRISRPIKALADDLLKVRMFEIDEDKTIDTRVKEVHVMSAAIHAMKVGLRSFQKYVPKEVVRKLISSGEAAKLGGRKEKLTLMFTDIKNFTAISEQMGVEGIMSEMNAYFDTCAKAVRDNKGVVDKYIGDAVMAFWGAPEQDEKQVIHACQAALDCQRMLAKMDKVWVQGGGMPLPTRIGLHTGDVIIGNLGSTDRLNYTAIGDTVNVTSRLEQLCKIYGTKIIVSQDIVDEAKSEFVFRTLDRVVVKGRKTSQVIYELIATSTPEAVEKYEPMCRRFVRGLEYYRSGEWDEATTHFQSVLELEPDDRPSKLFIKRCERFKKSPPTNGWDGTWFYHKKDA